MNIVLPKTIEMIRARSNYRTLRLVVNVLHALLMAFVMISAGAVVLGMMSEAGRGGGGIGPALPLGLVFLGVLLAVGLAGIVVVAMWQGSILLIDVADIVFAILNKPPADTATVNNRRGGPSVAIGVLDDSPGS